MIETLNIDSKNKASIFNTILMGGLIVLSIWPWFTGPYIQHLAILTCLNVLIVNGLSVIERSGQLSFGHSAFVAIGAYVSVLASNKLGFNIIFSSLLGVFTAGIVALILGWIILKLRGVYFVLVTFAFAEFVRLALLDFGGVTGGANGIGSIPAIEVFGFVLDTRARFYGLSLAAALLSLLFVWHLFRRPLGQSMDAVCDNSALAESTGLNVYRLQLIAFLIGCSMAALGGVLMARYITFISPESFNTAVSVALITMLVIGGRRSVWGPLVGAVVLTPLPEFFRGAVQTQHIFYGAALILILRFLPGGLTSLSTKFNRLKKVSA